MAHPMQRYGKPKPDSEEVDEEMMPVYEAAADAFVKELAQIRQGTAVVGVEMRAIIAAVNAAFREVDDD